MFQLSHNFYCYLYLQVCFSDESTVKIIMARRKFVRRTKLEKDHQPRLPEHKKILVKVMVWSVNSVMGPGRLEIIKGNLNQDGYREIADRCPS